MKDELKRDIDMAAEVNGRLLSARMAEVNKKTRLHPGLEMVNSWEHLPGSDDEVLVQMAIIRDHVGKPFIGHAYLRPHELECFDFEAGFLIAAGKAYRQMADSLTERGLAKVKNIFSRAERAIEHYQSATNLIEMVERDMRELHPVKKSHDVRLQAALKSGRVYVCDECSKPYDPNTHRLMTWKGTLYICPHCGKVVPKITLEKLEAGALVMPLDQVATVCVERLDGMRKMVEHKDGTITEELVEGAKKSVFEKGEGHAQSYYSLGLSTEEFVEEAASVLPCICNICRRTCKKNKWTCPDFYPPLQEGSLCADCGHNMRCGDSHKMISACPDHEPRPEEEVVQQFTKEERGAIEKRALEIMRNKVRAKAEAVCPKPSQAIGAYGAFVGAFAVDAENAAHAVEETAPVFTPGAGDEKCLICDQVDRVGELEFFPTACLEGEKITLCVGHADVVLDFYNMGMNHDWAANAAIIFNDGHYSKEESARWIEEYGTEKALEASRIAAAAPKEIRPLLDRVEKIMNEPGPDLIPMKKVNCVRCGFEMSLAEDNPTQVCPTCKEGGWSNMPDGEWHRVRYWKDPEGLKWDMFQSLCEKYLMYPEGNIVPDKNIIFDEEKVCTVCYEKHQGAK